MHVQLLRLDCPTRIPISALCAPARTGVYRRRRPERTCSIAPCRRTSPPGSNSPATAARALLVQPLSNVSSAGILNAEFLRMALPAPDVPSAVTIFTLPSRARAVVSVPLATPGEWSKLPLIWPTTFCRD